MGPSCPMSCLTQRQGAHAAWEVNGAHPDIPTPIAVSSSPEADPVYCTQYLWLDLSSRSGSNPLVTWIKRSAPTRSCGSESHLVMTHHLENFLVFILNLPVIASVPAPQL